MNDVPDFSARGFLLSATLLPDKVTAPSEYPFNLPVMRGFERLELHPAVTFLVGENGSGKSTLLEALAIAAGFNAEGGSQNMRFATHESHSGLHRALRLVRSQRRPRTGYFLRAESFFNVASELDRMERGGTRSDPCLWWKVAARTIARRIVHGVDDAPFWSAGTLFSR